jgi:hypothetical protein
MNQSILKGDNAMRKLSALLILTVVFFPLVVTVMSLIAIRPWVLDRDFYERMVSDERLYDAVLAWELPNQFNRNVFINEDRLPVNALNIALREVVTPDYLRTQSVNVVDQVFDFIEGQNESFEISFDITPLKTALAGEAGLRFANALAAALPPCESGQTAITPGGVLVRCIAVNSSVAQAADQIARALPVALEDSPDHVVLNDPSNLQNNWGFTNWFLGSSVRSALDLSMFTVIFTTLAVGLIGSFLGGDDLRGRLKWLGSSLFVPASLFVLMGLIMATPLIAGPLRNGLNAFRWEGIQYSEAFREAVIEIVAPLVQQIGIGFLITGLVSVLIAGGVLVWSWSINPGERRSSKMVQVPARNL